MHCWGFFPAYVNTLFDNNAGMLIDRFKGAFLNSGECRIFSFLGSAFLAFFKLCPVAF